MKILHIFIISILTISKLYSIEIEEIQAIQGSITFTDVSDNSILILDPTYGLASLKKGNDYKIHFKDGDEVILDSLAVPVEKPSSNATNIAFGKIEANSIEFSFNPGKGKKRYAIISTDSIYDFKSIKNTIKFNNESKSSEFIKTNNKNLRIIDVTSKNKGFIKVEDLAYDTYTFLVIETNGSGRYTSFNYEFSRSNPRSKHTRIATPINLKYEKSVDGYLVNWEKVKGVLYYEILAAQDIAFKQVIEDYNYMDTGKSNEWIIYKQEDNANMYLKVRAIGKYNKSKFSKVIQIK